MRIQNRLVLVGSLCLGCAKDDQDDDSAESMVSGTETSATISDSGTAGTGTGLETDDTGFDPDVVQDACENFCEIEIGCQPDLIPMRYDSLEDCVAGCVDNTALHFADGCGPEALMRLTCWSQLSCEVWLEFVETGFSPCGDDPGAQWCGD